MHDFARLKRTAAVLAVGAITILGTGCIPTTPQEDDTWVRTLTVRHDQGVDGLMARDDTLTARAQEWARSLAVRRVLQHSNLSTLATGWTAVAENVGRGGDQAQVMDGFLGSEHHRANLLDRRWTDGGVGVATAKDGTVYVVQLFEQR
jgi:uncharacterized protein YkwD